MVKVSKIGVNANQSGGSCVGALAEFKSDITPHCLEKMNYNNNKLSTKNQITARINTEIFTNVKPMLIVKANPKWAYQWQINGKMSDSIGFTGTNW